MVHNGGLTSDDMYNFKLVAEEAKVIDSQTDGLNIFCIYGEKEREGGCVCVSVCLCMYVCV